MAESNGPRPTALGVLASVGLILALLCVGAGVVLHKASKAPNPVPAISPLAAAPAEEAAPPYELQSAAASVPRLAPLS